LDQFNLHLPNLLLKSEEPFFPVNLFCMLFFQGWILAVSVVILNLGKKMHELKQVTNKVRHLFVNQIQ